MLKVIDVFIIMVYYIVAFFSLFYAKKLMSQKNFFLSIWLFTISIFFALRSIGLDLEPYREIFNEFRKDSLFSDGLINIFTGRIEPAFALLMSALKSLGLGFEFFLLLSGLIPTLIIIRVISLEYKEQFFIVFSFFIFLYFLKGPVDTIRGFAAAAMYLYALSSLAKKQNFFFSLKALAALSLHYSSLIIFLVVPFLKIKWDIKTYIIASFLFVFLGFTSSEFIKSTDLSGFATWHPLTFKIVYYLTYYQTDGYQYLNEVHFVFWWLLGLSFSVMIIFNSLHLLLNNRDDWTPFMKIVFNSQIVGTLIYFLFMSFGAYTMGGRILFLLAIGSIFMFTKAVEKDGLLKDSIVIYMFFIFSHIFISFSYLAGFFDPKSPFNMFG
jgi:hypothetical protein